MIKKVIILLAFLASSTCCFSQAVQNRFATKTKPSIDESSLAFDLENLAPKSRHEKNRTKHRQVKTTRRECEIRGGEYIAHKNALPNDMVDCILPSQARNLGGLFGGILGGTLLGGKSDGAIGEAASRKVLGSAYDYLYRVATEKHRYGLYTYVLAIFDYSLASKLLAQICDSPSEKIQDICSTDLSRGPYLFTYPNPASALSPAPPPYLFVDLSGVHERAFGEFVAAYKEQVKRSDFSDLERIDNLRLRVLSIVLTAADWIDPIKGAIADTIHMVGENGAAK